MNQQRLTQLWYERLDRAYQQAFFLRLLPFVKMIGLNGSMVTGTMQVESDIDFYIVTSPKRLYTVRLLSVVLIHLTGWRRYDNKVRGRICLNRFATTDLLEITPHHTYHARVFSRLAPLYAEKTVYENYCQKNEWMYDFGFPLYQAEVQPIASTGWRGVRVLIEYILGGWAGDKLEERLAKWQQSRINRDPRTRADGSKVVVGQNELCLHPQKERI